ncbi:MAG TPA: hypothetical protein VKB58_14825 [Terriglobales bacterium]|nr:hypothetical protein [Terriglobales bacterium]
MDVPLLELEKNNGNERTLAEAPRREEEYFLSVAEIAQELVALFNTVDEVSVVDDLAKDKGVFDVEHVTLTSVTLNGVERK